MDSEMIPDTEPQSVPMTQEQGKSHIKYSWAFLFKFDINEENPFCVVKLKDYLDTDFPWKLIRGEMTRERRIQMHEFSNEPGVCYFIFAKIEYGKYQLLCVTASILKPGLNTVSSNLISTKRILFVS